MSWPTSSAPVGTPVDITDTTEAALLAAAAGGTLDPEALAKDETGDLYWQSSATGLHRLSGSGGAYLGAGTWASRPTSGLTAGDTMRMTDIGRTPGTTFQWDGTRWRSLAGRYVLGESGTSIFVNSTTELATPSIRQLVPAALLPVGARISLNVTVDKGNTSVGGTARVRFGTAGNSGDTEITVSGGMNVFPAAAHLSGNNTIMYRLDSATAMRGIGCGSVAGTTYKLNGGSSADAETAVTVTNTGANDMYLSFNAYNATDVNTYIRDWQIVVED